MDFSSELDENLTQYYQGLIGGLRWIAELGKLELMMPVSLLARHIVSPREGHQ